MPHPTHFGKNKKRFARHKSASAPPASAIGVPRSTVASDAHSSAPAARSGSQSKSGGPATDGGGARAFEQAGTPRAAGARAYRSGFVAILGRPNAGKSTLLNRMVGQKVAIVASKPQTTRNRIQGIVTTREGQIVFIDTPGLHEPESALGRQMMHEVAAALEGIDLLLLMVDASRALPQPDAGLLDRAKRFRGKTILVLNKIDAIPKAKLLPLMEAYSKAFEFSAIVPVSALRGEGCDRLVREVLRQLPEGQPYFPEDQVTDQPSRFLAAEIIREKAIRAMHHELPYAVAVFVEKFEEKPNLLRIEAMLNVERDTQKKILIGHKGAMLKKIGTEARKELEKLLGSRIFLGLFVKVAPAWRENPHRVRELDWRFQLEGLSHAQGSESAGDFAAEPAGEMPSDKDAPETKEGDAGQRES